MEIGERGIVLCSVAGRAKCCVLQWSCDGSECLGELRRCWAVFTAATASTADCSNLHFVEDMICAVSVITRQGE